MRIRASRCRPTPSLNHLHDTMYIHLTTDHPVPVCVLDDTHSCLHHTLAGALDAGAPGGLDNQGSMQVQAAPGTCASIACSLIPPHLRRSAFAMDPKTAPSNTCSVSALCLRSLSPGLRLTHICFRFFPCQGHLVACQLQGLQDGESQVR